MSGQGFHIRFSGIVGFVFLILLFVALFFVAKGIFTLLSWLSPALILGALFINYRTVLNFLKYMWALLRRNPIGGILGVVLCVIGFPILSGVLFGKAILDRKVKKLVDAHENRTKGEFVEFEEVIREDNKQQIELPPLEKESPPQDKNQYKDLF